MKGRKRYKRKGETGKRKREGIKDKEIRQGKRK